MTRILTLFEGYKASFARGKPFRERVPWSSGVLSTVLQVEMGDNIDALEILGSLLKELTVGVVGLALVDGVGVGLGEVDCFGTGATDLIATPEFQTSFEPFLMHV